MSIPNVYIKHTCCAVVMAECSIGEYGESDSGIEAVKPNPEPPAERGRSEINTALKGRAGEETPPSLSFCILLEDWVVRKENYGTGS